MACCLVATKPLPEPTLPCHTWEFCATYLRHNFTASAQHINSSHEFDKYTSEITSTSLRGQWVNPEILTRNTDMGRNITLTWKRTECVTQHAHIQYIPRNMHTVFALLCFVVVFTLTDFPISIRLISLALWQSNNCPSASKATLMNMDKYFMWINYERLLNHNKAKHNKTVCIFLGIYCIRNLMRS